MTISVSEMGTAKTIHWVNEISGAPGKIDGTAPESTRFGPVPVSVAMPPIDDEYAMESSRPHSYTVPERRTAASSQLASLWQFSHCILYGTFGFRA